MDQGVLQRRPHFPIPLQLWNPTSPLLARARACSHRIRLVDLKRGLKSWISALWNRKLAIRDERRTERQQQYEGKPLFELGLPKRPVLGRRNRPMTKGMLISKEYMPRDYCQTVRIVPITR